MKKGFYGGVCYVELEGNEQPEITSWKWGHTIYQPGDKIERLGSGGRTRLEMKGLMIYVGKFDGYVLFDVENNTKESTQVESFPAAKRRMYIAPAWVADDILLMQSSDNGFWDIRP